MCGETGAGVQALEAESYYSSELALCVTPGLLPPKYIRGNPVERLCKSKADVGHELSAWLVPKAD